MRTASSSSRVSFALTARDQRLELTIGPLKPGTSELLLIIDPAGAGQASVAELADELGIEAIDQSELLRVVLIDQQRDRSGAPGQP